MSHSCTEMEEVDTETSGEEPMTMTEPEPSTDGEEPMSMDDCAEVGEEYEQCRTAVWDSFETTRLSLENNSTVEMLYLLETHVFANVEEFRQNLLEDMAWAISEGSASFTPLTIDDIPGCSMDISPVPASCIDELQPTLDQIDEARTMEATERNFQLFLLAYPCN